MFMAGLSGTAIGVRVRPGGPEYEGRQQCQPHAACPASSSTTSISRDTLFLRTECLIIARLFLDV